MRRTSFTFQRWLTLAVALALPVTLGACGGKSGGSGPTSPPATAPAAPTNVHVAAGDQSNVISWTAVSGATSYNLYFATGVVATTSSTKIAGVTSPHTHASLTNGTSYSYVVTAVN